VAGKYRTGKSFLLNRVIINQKNMGFGVGPTINPCTKGLWLWGDTLETEYHGEKLKILLIDSEGIGAFDEDDNHDSKIFLLALLLSSFFIYNSMGTIDENAINSLSLIINLSKELQIKSEVVAGESDPDEIAKYFPSFLWVVRDFSLRLLDNYGNQITSKEYFENAIQ
jgi:Guanylate-binding protein, N-terminal domain